jgi:hypothetical protein
VPQGVSAGKFGNGMKKVEREEGGLEFLGACGRVDTDYKGSSENRGRPDRAGVAKKNEIPEGSSEVRQGYFSRSKRRRNHEIQCA